MKKTIKPAKPSISGDIVTTESKIVRGSLINNKEVETKTDYIFYSNGNILLKSYRNNYLCSVSLIKDSKHIHNIL